MSLNKGRIITFTGRGLDPINPSPDDIDIKDIAHALSMICRFGGHSQKFYSVAEHCYFCSLMTEDLDLALILLLHDASEAYIHDIITPLKPFISSYKEIENNVMAAIFKKFELKWPIDDETKKKIKRIDNIMLLTEFKSFMTEIPEDCEIAKYYSPLDIKLIGCDPVTAEKYFMDRFNKLMTYKKNKEIKNAI